MGRRASDVLVVGGGVVGLTAAWRALVAGARVTVLDPAPGDGATRAAAGMLAPVGEAGFGQEPLARLGVASLALWPRFAAELERAASLPPGAVGLETTGTLVLAYDADDVAALRRLLDLHRAWGLPSHEIGTDAARRLEPAVGPRVTGAARAPGDHQVDPRAVHRALAVVVGSSPRATLVPRAATALTWARGAVTGARDDAGAEHRAGLVVLAAGHASGALHPDAPTRPVPGTALRLETAADLLAGHVVRGHVQGRPVYVVPRRPGADGRREVVVGATSDEREDSRTRSGDVFALLRDARALLPALDEATFVEATTRPRPGSPDGAPVLGEAAEGLLLATGHHRNGVLLTPLTAAVVDDALGATSPSASLSASPSASPCAGPATDALVAAALDAAARHARPGRFTARRTAHPEGAPA
ncbi:glycine oxidase ThiO [Xylanimonas oleitrophica]|uniref:glycine oxidase n=1 Tax=Xylanimonas oleitrophica TaxID=2607479 RepID=A0A2W5X005_9MICO|nr:glycine oxidase ThiO [Xylanimonas oleitrophica]PZR53535.1 glycine oxidase ThiO [Xylanimonas oleitrophica]